MKTMIKTILMHLESFKAKECLQTMLIWKQVLISYTMQQQALYISKVMLNALLLNLVGEVGFLPVPPAN